MKKMIIAAIVLVGMVAASHAQTEKSVDISAVAAAGAVTENRYSNSYFKLTVDAPNATLQLNPVVNTKGQFARLLLAESKPTKWEDTYNLSMLADSLTINPQVQSPAQYVRSVRHSLEKDGLPTVREEFPIAIAGVQFTGAVLQQPEQSGRKHYRGIYTTFRNGYVLTFDVEAASLDQLNKLVTGLVKTVN